MFARMNITLLLLIISVLVHGHKSVTCCFFFFTPQEEELRNSGEAKYAHLSNDLHVLIEVFAPPGEAYSRMSHALEEIKKFLVPVSLMPRLILSSLIFYSCSHV